MISLMDKSQARNQANAKRDAASIRRELKRAQPNQEPQPSAELAAKYARQIVETQFNNREAPKR